MRDSFVFYRSYHEALNELDDKTQLEIYQALAEYSLNEKEPNLTGISKAIFTLIKPNADANQRKYENGKKGAEHGKKGGRPRKEKTPKKPLKNPLGVIDENPKITPNVDVDVDVRCKMSNENEENKTPLPPEGEFDEGENNFLDKAKEVFQGKTSQEKMDTAIKIKNTALKISEKFIDAKNPELQHARSFYDLLMMGYTPNQIGYKIEAMIEKWEIKKPNSKIISWNYFKSAILKETPENKPT